MMTDDLRGSVHNLRKLAKELNITGNTNEQALLIAVIDTLDKFSDAIRRGADEAELFDGQPNAGILLSKCPNCGKEINLDLSDLQNGEPIVCINCNEAIGILTGNM